MTSSVSKREFRKLQKQYEILCESFLVNREEHNKRISNLETLLLRAVNEVQKQQREVQSLKETIAQNKQVIDSQREVIEKQGAMNEQLKEKKIDDSYVHEPNLSPIRSTMTIDKILVESERHFASLKCLQVNYQNYTFNPVTKSVRFAETVSFCPGLFMMFKSIFDEALKGKPSHIRINFESEFFEISDNGEFSDTIFDRFGAPENSGSRWDSQRMTNVFSQNFLLTVQVEGKTYAQEFVRFRPKELQVFDDEDASQNKQKSIKVAPEFKLFQCSEIYEEFQQILAMYAYEMSCSAQIEYLTLNGVTYECSDFSEAIEHLFDIEKSYHYAVGTDFELIAWRGDHPIVIGLVNHKPTLFGGHHVSQFTHYINSKLQEKGLIDHGLSFCVKLQIDDPKFEDGTELNLISGKIVNYSITDAVIEDLIQTLELIPSVSARLAHSPDKDVEEDQQFEFPATNLPSNSQQESKSEEINVIPDTSKQEKEQIEIIDEPTTESPKLDGVEKIETKVASNEENGNDDNEISNEVLPASDPSVEESKTQEIINGEKEEDSINQNKESTPNDDQKDESINREKVEDSSTSEQNDESIKGDDSQTILLDEHASSSRDENSVDETPSERNQERPSNEDLDESQTSKELPTSTSHEHGKEKDDSHFDQQSKKSDSSDIGFLDVSDLSESTVDIEIQSPKKLSNTVETLFMDGLTNIQRHAINVTTISPFCVASTIPEIHRKSQFFPLFFPHQKQSAQPMCIIPLCLINGYFRNPTKKSDVMNCGIYSLKSVIKSIKSILEHVEWHFPFPQETSPYFSLEKNEVGMFYNSSVTKTSSHFVFSYPPVCYRSMKDFHTSLEYRDIPYEVSNDQTLISIEQELPELSLKLDEQIKVHLNSSGNENHEKVFNSFKEYLINFVAWTLERYTKIRSNTLDNLARKLEQKKTFLKFATAIKDQQLNIIGKSPSEVFQQMLDLGFITNAENKESLNHFTKFMAIPIRLLTSDRIKGYERSVLRFTHEFQKLKNRSAKDIYRNDLDTLSRTLGDLDPST